MAKTVQGSPSSLATGRVTVGTSATLIVAARSGRAKVRLSFPSAPPVFLGGSDVTTSDGYTPPLNANGSTEVELGTEDAVYGIVTSGTVVVPFIELYD